MLRSLAAVAAMLVLALAGCLGDDDASEGALAEAPDGPAADGRFPVYGKDRPLHSLREILPFQATARDEIVLRGHVYLPDGEGPFATILEYSPYFDTTQGRSDGQAVQAPDGRTTLANHLGKFLDAGFAVALVNIRGTGGSGGCNAWLDPTIDGPDAAAVIDKLSNEPWSNGKVGMVGVSWPGYTQFAALYDPPPALKAVAPSSGIPDGWSLVTRRGPTINTQFGPMAVFYTAAMSLTAVGIEGVTNPEHVPCPSYAEHVAAHAELDRNGDKTEFWTRRDNRPIVANTSIPMFVTNGLTTGEGHILQFEGLWDLMPAEKRMLIGQFPHGYPPEEDQNGYDAQIVAWYDHYLRDGPELVQTGVVEYQDDEGTWHRTDRWPPASTPTTLHLSGASLVDSPDQVTPSRQTFVGRSEDPGAYDCPGLHALYVSPPLAEDVELVGNFLVDLTLESSLPNGNLGVFLYHVDEVGACTERRADLSIVSLLLDDGYPGEVKRALSDLRHRGGYLEIGRDFPTSGSDEVHMSSHPFASSAKAGERLVLAVSGGGAELTPRPETPLLTVVTGEGLAGSVTIPVVSGTLRFE